MNNREMSEYLNFEVSLENNELIISIKHFINRLNEIKSKNSNKEIKKEISQIIHLINQLDSNLFDLNNNGFLLKEKNEYSLLINKDYFLDELLQIKDSQTIERVQYYIDRLIKGFTEVKTNKYNDINLNRWKEYNHILTDSLWLFDKRDNSGVHVGDYWGNFVPQIPNQMLQRYTKKGEWVLDGFLGLGTTLIECKRLGRNGIGIELNPLVAKKAEKIINLEKNPSNVQTLVFTGDSQKLDIKKRIEEKHLEKVQLIILHPPYHDIIKFSEDNPDDLSNAESTEEFIKMFDNVIKNLTQVLEQGRYLVLVIGDKYSKGEWIPLGFLTMNEVIKNDYTLVSIIVKNFKETKGKRQQHELWRYRALTGGFYVFKHEYVMVFKKN